MEIVCIQGTAPGRIVATLSHRGRVRQIPMTVARHPAGGWHVAHTQRDFDQCDFGPRCHVVSTAVLLEASEAFMEIPMELAAD